MGVALQTYHDVHRVFPRGGWPPPTANLSWSSAILPYMGEQPVYDLLNPNAAYSNPSNLTAGQVLMTEFICPTSIFPSLYRAVDRPAELGPAVRPVGLRRHGRRSRVGVADFIEQP